MTEQEAYSRWEHYFMRSGSDCSVFWMNYLTGRNRKVLFILGLGFDPRMCLGLQMILTADPNCVKECLLIRYNEGSNSPSLDYQGRVDANVADIQNLLNGKGIIREADVPMMSTNGRRVGSRQASNAIEEDIISKFDDIVVDISSMPRGLYFPIISKLLLLLDTLTGNGVSSTTANLHVLVAEEVSIDEKIQEKGIDDQADYMFGFSSDLVRESTANAPKIWIPVLGEGKNEQLIRIYDHVRPDEICPVFPSPSVNPRRADNLVQEYRKLLFDRLQVEPSNFIYASEWNPFEVYRQIRMTIERYNSALEALGKCKVVVSVLSNKLLSVGALLAAYEAKQNNYMIGISHVETHGYQIHGDIVSCNPKLYSLWIAGECYYA